MKLEVVNIKVRSLSVDFNEVSWEVPVSTLDALDYTFQVLRSESIEGPYLDLSPTFEDRYIFVDNTLKGPQRDRQTHYKIRVTHKASGEVVDYGPASRSPEVDLIAGELQTHLVMLMREFAGRRSWVLPARTFGQRCSCWNETLRKRTRSGCRTCYDRGFVRGYLSPIEMWSSIDPNPATNQTSQVGKLQQSDTTGRAGYWPPLKPDDLLIEPENKRWRIRKVSKPQHGRVGIYQELELHEIPSSDIEYLIPLELDDDLRNIFFSPERNFTNPFDLSEDGGDLSDVFALYGGCR
jgi:hypothetical protein